LGRWHADAPAALFVIRGSAQEAGQRLDGDQAGGGSGAIFTASPAWATTVISPLFRSFTETSLCGLRPLRNCAAPIAVSFVSRYERGFPSTSISNMAPGALRSLAHLPSGQIRGYQCRVDARGWGNHRLGLWSFMLQGSPKTPLEPLVRVRQGHLPQSSSATRFTAGAFGP
jgi:hypothetical protein